MRAYLSSIIFRFSVVCGCLWIIVVGLSMHLITAPWWVDLAVTGIPAFIIMLLGIALAWVFE